MADRSRILDYVGISASSLCLIHCLALPTLFATAPALQLEVFAGPWFHKVMLAFVVPLASVAYIYGYTQHKKLWILSLGMASMTLLAVPVAVEFLSTAAAIDDCRKCCDASLFERDQLILYGGSLGLITAHLCNHREQGCPSPDDQCCAPTELVDHAP